MDHGPRTRVTGAVSLSAVDFVEGGGTTGRGGGSGIADPVSGGASTSALGM